MFLLFLNIFPPCILGNDRLLKVLFFFVLQIHPRAAAVFQSPPATITTDVEAVFHLLFAHGLALAPMSLYGVAPEKLLIRITASCGADEMTVLLDRIRAVADTYPAA